jgi:hypothetical protein
MGIHCVTYYDEPDGMETVDVDYQCSASCMQSTIMRETGLVVTGAGTVNLEDGSSISYGAFPCLLFMLREITVERIE